MIMVKAGQPVDDVIAELKPLLAKGDLLIDGGNSLFSDTERRVKELAPDGILFLGTGVSGGEEGALNGPSIMPGGSRRSLQNRRADLYENRRAGGRNPLLHLYRRRRRGALCQDGA